MKRNLSIVINVMSTYVVSEIWDTNFINILRSFILIINHRTRNLLSELPLSHTSTGNKKCRWFIGGYRLDWRHESLPLHFDDWRSFHRKVTIINRCRISAASCSKASAIAFHTFTTVFGNFSVSPKPRSWVFAPCPRPTLRWRSRACT